MIRIYYFLAFILLIFFQSKADNNIDKYSTIYSAKECRFLYVIDSIITKTPMPEAKQFIKKKYFECDIFKNNINSQNIDLKKDEYLFIIWDIDRCKNSPYVTKYFFKYKNLYYGFRFYISELFASKLYKKLRPKPYISVSGIAWYFHIKNGVLHKYQFDPIGYDDAPDSVKYVINKECYIPLWY
jgi:hypothetical protein